MSTDLTRLYKPTILDGVEGIEDYREGGFHPVHLADSFNNDRYRVLHKLGAGGFSTIWLASDLVERRNVSLKILKAEVSESGIELEILQHLTESTLSHPGRSHVASISDHFTITGPNGTHTCLVLSVAGPSIYQICQSPGEVAGNNRLRGDIARICARQLTDAVGFLHSIGVVHGDITTSNTLIQLADVDSWTEDEVYDRLGTPVKEKVITLSQSEPVASAPEYVIEATDLSHIDSKWLTERVLLIDFSVSFFSASPPAKGIGTPFSYRSPEAIFDLKAGIDSDIWALGCSIFELRAGCQLFESFVGGPGEVTRQIVQTLGKLPSPWWDKWELRKKYFEEDGKLKTKWENNIPLAFEYSLAEQIRDIGSEDNVEENSIEEGGIKDDIGENNAEEDNVGEDNFGEDNVEKDNIENNNVGKDTVGHSSTSAKSFLEVRGTRLSEQESSLLEELLNQMVVYDTNKRLPADKARNHPWFSI